MFVVRNQQMDAFQRVAERRFETRMVDHLHRDFPTQLSNQGISHERLDGFVSDGIRKARDYEIQYENDIERFLDCMAVLGVNFDNDPSIPWAEEILSQEGLAGEAKVDELWNYVVFMTEDLADE